jgi:exodeoxyribonuclease V beta subunit
MPATQTFSPISTPLQQGISLLEASAGTGKTYAIAMLALRFVVENNLAIEKILIVTFTKAATKELKERVRARLAEAKAYLSGQIEPLDSNISLWADTLMAAGEIDAELILKRINIALLNIDQAGIFTIHGFCQRLLTEHALESGQMFDVELSDEVASVQQQLVDDFWRVQIYPRPAWQVALLCYEHNTPDALLASLGNVSASLKILPENAELATIFNKLPALLESAHQVLNQQGEQWVAGIAAGYFKKTYTKKFVLHYATLKTWLAEMTSTEKSHKPRPSDSCFACFSAQTFSQELLKAGVGKISFDNPIFDQLLQQLQAVTLILRRNLAQELQDTLEIKLQQLNIMSHDSLITRTAKAIHAESGDLLIKAVEQQYSIALIDEFQDTDKTQWHIFSRLFASPKQALYLIGDPKQAIYKFRGADIHTYLSAKKQATQHYTLAHNWRSHPNLVAAINQLFLLNDNPFVFSALEFNAVAPALTAEQGMLVQNDTALPPLALWQLEASKEKHGHWSSGKAADTLKQAICKEVLHLLTAPVCLKTATHESPLKPADIAILVRSNAHASLYQAALKELNIPAIINSSDSVFKQKSAHYLHQLMQALAEPDNFELLKPALTLPWFALDGQKLNRLLDNEIQLNGWIERFQAYHLLWQKKGFLAMMLHLLNQECVYANIAKTPDAERQITDIQHLLELVQQASLDQHLGRHKTNAWLARAMTNKRSNEEEQQLRLESDADAVKVITVHRSKGLEYPVVFCPYLWYRKNKLASEKHLINCHKEGEMISDLGSEFFDQHRAIAIEEELAEDLRLIYVALTRAKYRCYTPWVNVRSAKKINLSAFAYLLSTTENFATLDFSEQQQLLQNLAEQNPHYFSYDLITADADCTEKYQQKTATIELTALTPQRTLTTTWQMSSYSALTNLSQHDHRELSLDRAEELYAKEIFLEKLQLAKGTQTGNVIHELLEYCRFTALAARQNIDQLRDIACLRHGLKIEQPERLNELLFHTVSTALSAEDANFYLANIQEEACLKEMPFYLSLSAFTTEKINQILKYEPTYQRLSAKEMQGYLTGFIDLICVYQGRYYVIDYKSNALTHYQENDLIVAMREHNYGLQFWIYSVVLHLYLQKRLENYQFAEHFGGVRYLFVRGMQADIPMSGVFSTLPNEQVLEELSAVFLDK